MKACQCIAGLGLLGVSLLAGAAEWFVSPAGSDATGNGSLASPYKTLGHLLSPERALVQAGDTVTLRGPAGNNVFHETEVRLRVPLTLRSHAGEWAVISCPINLPDGVCIQIDPSASGSRLSRLEVMGGNLYGLFFQTDWDARDNRGGKGASNVIVEDCKVHDTGRDAIKITPKSDDITIRRCEIYNTGRAYPPGTPLDDKNAEGIDNVNGSRMRVEDNHIHDIATTGLYFKGGAADVLVQRNRIERTGVGGIMVGFDTSPDFFDTTINPQYYESIRGTVVNNVVRDTGYAGIGLYAAQDALVAHNTVVNAARSGHAAIYFGVTLQDFDPVAVRPPTVNPVIRNNLVIQSGGDCVGIRWANEISAAGVYGLSGAPGTDFNWYHNTSGECRFFDNRPGSPLADGGGLALWRSHQRADANSLTGTIGVTADGHLLAGSPAIDKGVALPQVREDLDRQVRNAPVDIGADEAGASASAADRVMNWAEATYPSYFPKGASAGSQAPYVYRYYASTGTYLGTDGTRVVLHNGRDWNLLDVGALADFLALAAAAGF
ncbi:MAG: right-handed parallel beta-helix repeat-containing protein [Burkholderiales bacterium]|nr:right-handed parallel beta-helix repeat-containing protein [Burkholderiales bacterium]